MTDFAVLHAGSGSLVIEPVPDGAPLWRHCGPRVEPGMLPALAITRTAASFSLDRDCPLSTAPVAGTGWFGPRIVALRRDGAALDLAWSASRTEADEGAVTIVLHDDAAEIELVQHWRRAADAGWRVGAVVTNRGTAPVTIDWLASVLVPLSSDGSSESGRVIAWRGRHNAELIETEEALPETIWLRETRRGISGHGGAPGVYVLGPSAGWHAGEALAVQLCWSGDSRIAIERDDEGYHILSAGALLQPGEAVLAPGESRAAPDALLAVGTAGRNGVMAAQHAMVRAMQDWPGGRMTPRKVHLNSWEACYFDHDADRIVALARAAAAIGIERFVLDDGWFAGRNDDRAGLGDWTPDRVKYPHGLAPLAQAVRDLGMEFGLWVEPEMVNPDSDLYRAHPDWALHRAGGPLLTARGQLVLNMARADVRDALFAALDAVLRQAPVGYLKWDHNRDLVPAGGAAQVAGTYALLARLRAAHPEVEIESCAGGGGRSDAGMVPFVHRFWTSDNIDAVSRVAMQRGFLAFLPPEMMGSHIGASPAHATGRSQSLGFRAAVASAGHFGVELDPAALDPADHRALGQWIGFARDIRALVHGGGTWLGQGRDGLMWQAQGTADHGLLLWVIRCAPPLDRRPRPIPLPFLAGEGALAVRMLGIAGGHHGHQAPVPPIWADDRAQIFGADWLVQAGLPLPPLRAHSVALFHIVRDTPGQVPVLPAFPVDPC
jgi:alpha-galactosidase